MTSTIVKQLTQAKMEQVFEAINVRTYNCLSNDFKPNTNKKYYWQIAIRHIESENVETLFNNALKTKANV